MSDIPEEPQEEKPNTSERLYAWLMAKYGRLGGTLVFMIFIMVPLLGLIPLNIGGVIFCATLVVEASWHISSFAASITTVTIGLGLLVLIYGLIRPNPIVPSLLSSQPIIALLAFVQTFFWVIDSQNTIHEPRSVFLLVVSAGLAYYEKQISNLAEQTTPTLNSIVQIIQSATKNKAAV